MQGWSSFMIIENFSAFNLLFRKEEIMAEAQITDEEVALLNSALARSNTEFSRNVSKNGNDFKSGLMSSLGRGMKCGIIAAINRLQPLCSL